MKKLVILLLVLGGVLVALVGAVLAGARPTAAAFPGANGKIAFTTNRDGNNEVYVMNPDGTGQTNLTKNPALDWSPAWSPDGSKIAFLSDRSGTREVYRINADSTDLVQLTTGAAAHCCPTWSPGGTKIAFGGGSYWDGTIEIYVMNSDGTGLTNLTNNSVNDSQPAWSPDGTKIAFVSDQRIHVMNADGTGVTSLGIFGGNPDWSPDGARIVFSAWTGTWRQGGGGMDIFVINSDGTALTNLVGSKQNEQDPVWSPDGKKIAFTYGTNTWDIAIMNSDGTGRRTLTKNAQDVADSAASWQRLLP